jgi:hypothetical protein
VRAGGGCAQPRRQAAGGRRAHGRAWLLLQPDPPE